jgi:hypothetical protein
VVDVVDKEAAKEVEVNEGNKKAFEKEAVENGAVTEKAVENGAVTEKAVENGAVTEKAVTRPRTQSQEEREQRRRRMEMGPRIYQEKYAERKKKEAQRQQEQHEREQREQEQQNQKQRELEQEQEQREREQREQLRLDQEQLDKILQQLNNPADAGTCTVPKVNPFETTYEWKKTLKKLEKKLKLKFSNSAKVEDIDKFLKKDINDMFLISAKDAQNKLSEPALHRRQQLVRERDRLIAHLLPVIATERRAKLIDLDAKLTQAVSTMETLVLRVIAVVRKSDNDANIKAMWFELCGMAQQVWRHPLIQTLYGKQLIYHVRRAWSASNRVRATYPVALRIFGFIEFVTRKIETVIEEYFPTITGKRPSFYPPGLDVPEIDEADELDYFEYDDDILDGVQPKCVNS